MKKNIFRDSWKTNKDNIIKLGAHMYNGIANMALHIVKYYTIGDVITSKNK